MRRQIRVESQGLRAVGNGLIEVSFLKARGGIGCDNWIEFNRPRAVGNREVGVIAVEMGPAADGRQRELWIGSKPYAVLDGGQFAVIEIAERVRVKRAQFRSLRMASVQIDGDRTPCRSEISPPRRRADRARLPLWPYNAERQARSRRGIRYDARLRVRHVRHLASALFQLTYALSH